MLITYCMGWRIPSLSKSPSSSPTNQMSHLETSYQLLPLHIWMILLHSWCTCRILNFLQSIIHTLWMTTDFCQNLGWFQFLAEHIASTFRGWDITQYIDFDFEISIQTNFIFHTQKHHWIATAFWVPWYLDISLH